LHIRELVPASRQACGAVSLLLTLTDAGAIGQLTSPQMRIFSASYVARGAKSDTEILELIWDDLFVQKLGSGVRAHIDGRVVELGDEPRVNVR
jgi:hypothetical protein